jgi:hypothetical protein
MDKWAFIYRMQVLLGKVKHFSVDQGLREMILMRQHARADEVVGGRVVYEWR